jgi:DNA-binding transcriptional MerR regulator
MEGKEINTNEVAKKLGCSTDGLRKYEQYFNLKIKRNKDNNRVYEDKDVEIFSNILKLKESGLGLAPIKEILDRTVEATERKIEVLKSSDLDQLKGKDFETIITAVLNQNLDGLTQRMDTMLKRQDEIIVNQNQKIIEMEEENKQLRDENMRLKNLKWWQKK